MTLSCFQVPNFMKLSGLRGIAMSSLNDFQPEGEQPVHQLTNLVKQASKRDPVAYDRVDNMKENEEQRSFRAGERYFNGAENLGCSDPSGKMVSPGPIKDAINSYDARESMLMKDHPTTYKPSSKRKRPKSNRKRSNRRRTDDHRYVGGGKTVNHSDVSSDDNSSEDWTDDDSESEFNHQSSHKRARDNRSRVKDKYNNKYYNDGFDRLRNIKKYGISQQRERDIMKKSMPHRKSVVEKSFHIPGSKI